MQAGFGHLLPVHQLVPEEFAGMNVRVISTVVATGLIVSGVLAGGVAVATEKPAALKSLTTFSNPPAAPTVTFASPDGRSTSLADFKGRTVVVNFWATWCAPCIKEMPSLDRLAGSLPEDRFAVVAISQDVGGIAAARPFLDRYGIKHLTAYAEPAGKLARMVGSRGLPTTLIIGPDGKVIGSLEGMAEWDHPDVISFLSQFADDARSQEKR